MNIKNLLTNPKAKIAAFGAALTAPVFAMAADGDAATTAAAAIENLKTGVGTVGAALLGVTLVIVGYRIIMRMSNRS